MIACGLRLLAWLVRTFELGLHVEIDQEKRDHFNAVQI